MIIAQMLMASTSFGIRICMSLSYYRNSYARIISNAVFAKQKIILLMFIRICNPYTFQIDMTAFIFLASQTIETVQIPSLLPNSYTLKILQTRQYYEERLEPNQLVSLPWVQIYCYVVYAIIDVIFCYPCNSSGMRILNTYNIISFQNIFGTFPRRKKY